MVLLTDSEALAIAALAGAMKGTLKAQTPSISAKRLIDECERIIAMLAEKIGES